MIRLREPGVVPPVKSIAGTRAELDGYRALHDEGIASPGCCAPRTRKGNGYPAREPVSYPGEEHRRDAGDLDGYLSLYDEGIALHGYSPEPMNKDQVPRLLPGDIQRL